MKSLIESLKRDYPLEEDNTTSSVEPINTPKAFKQKYEPEPDKLEEMMSRLLEINYKDFKNDTTTSTRQKINKHVLEINKRLREVEQMLTHASKLKTESGSDQSVFWKKTLGEFQKIDRRLNTLSTKIREMNT